MEFPDDPTYEDEWDTAQRFVEACGPEAALHAAFLQTATSGGGSDDDEELLSADAILFPDEAESGPFGSRGLRPAGRGGSEEAEVAVKAAALVRLHRKLVTAA